MKTVTYCNLLHTLPSEADTNTETPILQVVYMNIHQTTIVGGVTVIGSKMKAGTIDTRVKGEAQLGGSIKAPRIPLGLKDIEVGLQFGIFSAHLGADIGLESTSTVPGIARSKAKGQLESGMLLVGGETAMSTCRQSLSAHMLVVAVEIQKKTDGIIVSDISASLERHAPPTGMFTEVIADG